MIKKVSVIMPTYNSAAFVGESISSVLNQSYSNLELYIIDDCSTDDTVEFIRTNFQDERLTLIKNARNMGPGYSRQLGISMSDGDYLAFCDSDDVWQTGKIETQISNATFVNDPDCLICFTSYKLTDTIKTQLVRARNRVDFTDMLRRNYIGMSTAVVKRSGIGTINFPDYRLRQDWAFWLDLLVQSKKFYAIGIVKPLVNIIIQEESISKRKWNLLIPTYNIYRRHLCFTKLGSFFRTIQFLFYQFKEIKNREYIFHKSE